jgi:dihydrofolate reductase
MRRIIVSEMLTADGVMQGPGGPDEDRSGGFEHGGWQAAMEADEFQIKQLQRPFLEADAFLLGRKTYEIFAGYWPHHPDIEPFGRAFNEHPKHVVSRTLSEPLGWRGSSLIGDEVVERVRDLKHRDGGAIAVIGSGELVQTLLANDLVDELQLFVFPVVLGTGKRLFREGLPALNLEPLGSSISEFGSIWLKYRPTLKLAP